MGVIRPGDGDPRHGTQNGYVNLGCRCDDCRRAQTTYHREYMHRKGTVPRDVLFQRRRLASVMRDNHGTETRYVLLGCRCDACKAASAEARRRRRHANPETTREYERNRKRRERARVGSQD